MTTTRCWTCLGTVEVGPLYEWLALARPHWPAPSGPSKPQRIEGPAELVHAVVGQVLGYLDVDLIAHRPVLSRVLPGQSHDWHVDKQRSDWVTRIHVPLVTNFGCWMAWEEEEGMRIHFEVGKAYTFDTSRRHAFGNHGPSERIHLMFDVLRGHSAQHDLGAAA